MEGVEPGVELGPESVVDGAVASQARHSGERRRPDLHGIMCLAAGGGPRMPMVKVRLVNYIQLMRRKSSFQRGLHALCAACQFLRH
jgi:hypothetical protein